MVAQNAGREAGWGGVMMVAQRERVQVLRFSGQKGRRVE